MTNAKTIVEIFDESSLSSESLMLFLVIPFPNKPWFLHVCCTRLLKTLWEKEKLLVRSNFSFSGSFFYQFGELSAIFIKFVFVVRKLFQFGIECKICRLGKGY